VAGSANNQLANAEAAGMLRERGILYAPDYVINAGGVIGLVGLEELGWGASELNAGLESIGVTLREIYERADSTDMTTAEAAELVVGERLRS
jgi:leucine dehydrogenase